MLGKTPGAILCAHCAKQPGAKSCAGCQLEVCEACAADWTTCSIASGVELELGRGRMLYAVDGAGARALVGRKRSLMQRVFNAHPQLSFLDLATGYEERVQGSFSSPPLVHMCRDGRAVWTQQVSAGDHFFSVVRTSVRGETSQEFGVDTALSGGVTPEDGVVWDFHDNLLYTFDLATKSVVRYAGLPRALAPLSASLDGPERLLAIGLWQELRVYRSVGGEVELVSKLAVDGELVGCVIRNRRIVCLPKVELGDTHLAVFELTEDGLRPAPSWRPRVVPSSQIALSHDARFCAVVEPGGSVLVHDFELGETQSLDGHRSAIELLRFTDGAQSLISSSANGQVLIRKRTGSAFAERCIKMR